MNHLRVVSRITLCISVFFFTCGGPRVLIPPRIDLKSYAPIGMIQLESNAKGNLAEFTSQRVLRTLQDAQPGVAVVELGAPSVVLGAVGRSQLDIEAVRLICAKYGVGGILWGNLQVEKVKPAVNIGSLLSSLTVSAYVEANLSLKFVESKAGATVWSNFAQGRENVASVSLMRGDTWFNAKDPEKAYGSLVRHLVSNVTVDFWSHWQ